MRNNKLLNGDNNKNGANVIYITSGKKGQFSHLTIVINSSKIRLKIQVIHE